MAAPFSFNQLPKTARNIENLYKFREHYDEAKTDEERFKMTYDHLSLLKALPVIPEGNVSRVSKSASRSAQLRAEGNELFPKSNKAALESYNRSVAVAPYPASEADDSTQLAFALGNRSLVYFKQGKYEVALKDIGLAFKYKYPDSSKEKLLRRRVECYKNLGKMDEAAASLQDAEEFAQTGKIATVTKAEDFAASRTPEQIEEEEEEKASAKSYGCVEIKYSPVFGRHLVATRDLRPGDILTTEKPYASILMREHHYTHCYNCLKRSDGMIPCRHCASVMYCSEWCRDASWRNYHDTECPLLGYLLEHLDNEIVLLGFRTWLVSYKRCGGVRELSEHMAREVSSGLPPPHALTSHPHHPAPLVFATSAVALVHWLEVCTDLLRGHPRETVGVALLRYMRVAQFNSFRVNEAVLDRSRPGVGPTKQTLGGGLYNLLSLCNHACWPNATRFFRDGDTKVLFAQLPIKKGEQIYILYAGDFKTSALAERTVTTRDKFFFECRCAACVNDWPLYGALTADDPRVLCTACHATLQRKYSGRNVTLVCLGCRTGQSMEAVGLWLEAIFAELFRLSLDVHTGERDEKTNTTARAAKVLEDLYERVEMPFLPMVDCQELIAKSYYKNLGNYTVL